MSLGQVGSVTPENSGQGSRPEQSSCFPPLSHPGSQPLPTDPVPPWGLRHQFIRICVHTQTEVLSQLAQDEC